MHQLNVHTKYTIQSANAQAENIEVNMDDVDDDVEEPHDEL